ncbi:hypothetical protein [Streptomyces flavofungini]|uniref:Uncharacterized protein n=1 Tax=Streptomyces flavofungini TaxID=68200 RepID=A0ABS0XBA4_9ACTN|nr:hypothetical protein [Streptomyces flavofungini]MBJ3810490.1 hypothetical protein [Streptomyces flavofungini]GHC41708.1 hypothetical protein GCM10010349_02020 [Streptomyces flavofungini]
MRTARQLTTAAALAVTSAGLCAAPATAAAAGPAGGLQVSPATVTPGTSVTVRTTACGVDGTATGDASAVGAGTFALAPGARAKGASGRFKVPSSAQPGTYEIVARCGGSGGREVAGDLSVTLTSTASARAEQPVPVPVHPKGHVKTGVGGALGPDPVKTAAGVAVLAVAAAGGTWLLHRRARGDRI